MNRRFIAVPTTEPPLHHDSGMSQQQTEETGVPYDGSRNKHPRSCAFLARNRSDEIEFLDRHRIHMAHV